ncbi:MAG: hypothetical protein ABI573_09330 [Chloroflexota bacterium]
MITVGGFRGSARIAIAGMAVVMSVVGCASTVIPSSDPTTAPGTTFTSSPGPTSSVGSSPTDGGCVVAPQSGLLRSNTLIDLVVDSDGASDRIAFKFGPVAPGPTGGTGRLTAATPPFSQGASGLPVDVLGTHHVELHLDGMLVVDEAGNGVFKGPTSLKPAMIALKDVEETDGFEGVYNFVIGYDGNGCVGLTGNTAAGSLTVTIGH